MRNGTASRLSIDYLCIRKNDVNDMKTKKMTQRDYIKANRKASREAEIEQHTRPVNFCRVHQSKKVYDRKRSKAEYKKALPSFFYLYLSRLSFSL